MPAANRDETTPLEAEQIHTTVIRRFNDEWTANSWLRISELLPADSIVRESLVVELVRLDLEHSWRLEASASGAPINEPHFPRGRRMLEDYVRQLPVLGSLERIPQPLIIQEFRLRRAAAEEPSIAEYALRFPHFGKKLLAELEQVARETLAPAFGTQPSSSQQLRWTPKIGR
jgi:hypothetical protein